MLTALQGGYEMDVVWPQYFNIYIYIYLYLNVEASMHTYIYIYICVCVCVCLCGPLQFEFRQTHLAVFLQLFGAKGRKKRAKSEMAST